MSAPDRLLAGGVNDFERELLASWHSRQPSPEARARTLARVGVGVGTAVLAATTAKTAGGSLAPKAVAATSVLAKGLAIGATVVTLTAGTLGYVHHVRHMNAISDHPASAAQAPVASARAAVGSTAEATPAESRVGATPADEIELGRDVAPSPRESLGPTRGKSTSASKSTLDEEVALMGQARQAQAGGDSAGALQLLNTYDSRYPNGSLARESVEIRIEALVALGNRAAAQRLATRFIASHPSGLDARNIRRALSGLPRLPTDSVTGGPGSTPGEGTGRP
jgi:hypothetical protein